MVAIHAAAAVAKAQSRVLDAFRVHGATAPERARPLAELGIAADDRMFRQLAAAGVIRGVDARGRDAVLGDAFGRVDGYYLDEAAFVAHRDGRERRDTTRALRIVAVFALALLAAGLALVVTAGRG